MATAAAEVHLSPPPLTWRTVASFVCTHFAWATADAVICLFLASFWLLNWGMATSEIGRLACGEGCAVVTVAYKVISVAAKAIVVLVAPFIVLLMPLMVPRTLAAAAESEATATDTEAAKEQTSLYAALRDMLCDSLILGLLVSLVFVLLMPIGDLVKGGSPMMGSRRERIGSVIYDVGSLGNVMVYCLVLCPIMTVRICKAWTWRMARAWRKAQYAL